MSPSLGRWKCMLDMTRANYNAKNLVGGNYIGAHFLVRLTSYCNIEKVDIAPFAT